MVQGLGAVGIRTYRCLGLESCYEMRRGLRAYRGAGCLARTWLQLMCCTTRHLLSSNFRNRFRGLGDEFEGQSMLISNWGTYMKFGTYLYRERACVRDLECLCVCHFVSLH